MVAIPQGVCEGAPYAGSRRANELSYCLRRCMDVSVHGFGGEAEYQRLIRR